MNAFEQITKSPEVLGEFLRGLPVIEAPWDREFQERFCADCLYLNCDGCPHEEYRNNPLWWLLLETENGGTQEKSLEVIADGPRSENGWISGGIGHYRFCAKVYDKPSKFGIKSGRVSKIAITDGPIRVVADYDRGWNISPENKENESILQRVLAFLESLPTEE